MRYLHSSIPKRPRDRSLLARVVVPTLFSALLCSTALYGTARADKPAPTPPPKGPTVPAETPAPAKPAKDKSPATCADVVASTMSEAFGYKHIVTLRNGCDKPVECQVWTDVDPTPRHVLTADKGEMVDVVTRIGSPASAFKAFKECRYR
jgi:hypothetical protein